MGISIYPHDGTDMNELMKNADAAMYRAKAQGKNNFQVYTKELNKQLMERMELENYLRRAVEKMEFEIFYQPQVDTKTGRIVSNEALLRWHNEEKGWISPEVFIAIAEEIGLINAIGEWVMRNACIQLAKWHEDGYSDLKVSVNLSAKQFQQGDFLDMVNGIIDETGIDPEWLELEITESLAMQDLDHTVDVLQRLRQKGVSISMDDFGKGYSSLNYLWRLPINNLKIDKTFIHNITTDCKQAKIAKALITLAHSMQLTVTAEGVETFEQFKFLRNENCDLVQGYLFSKPKSADELCMECVDMVAAGY
jgi:EAL domain-containing protein (putative c-di-GMP-specific phosphodiesterase class I)